LKAKLLVTFKIGIRHTWRVANGLDSAGLVFIRNSFHFETFSDVTQNGFCIAGGFCGWHNFNVFNNQQYKYAFIGVPPNTCGCIRQSVSPNGNPGVDALINVISHELAETATDPLLTGWWSSFSGFENADLCNFYFPSSFTNTMANGAKYDITFGGNNYYIQVSI